MNDVIECLKCLFVVFTFIGAIVGMALCVDQEILRFERFINNYLDRKEERNERPGEN